PSAGKLALPSARSGRGELAIAPRALIGSPAIRSRMRGLASGERVKATDRLRPFIEKARGFRGWSLEEVAPTRIGPRYPWDYRHRAADLFGRASSVLDMGTGGGELFADLCRGRRGRAVATEPWHVNAPIAKRDRKS